MIEALIALVMRAGVMVTSHRRDKNSSDGAPYAVKVARTVWVRGKRGDKIKALPIDIIDSADTAAVDSGVWRSLRQDSPR